MKGSREKKVEKILEVGFLCEVWGDLLNISQIFGKYQIISTPKLIKQVFCC